MKIRSFKILSNENSSQNKISFLLMFHIIKVLVLSEFQKILTIKIQ